MPDKLAAVQAVIFTVLLFAASVGGTLTLIHRLHGRREKIPFPLGPFLAVGCLAAYFIKIGGLIL